MTGLPRRLRSEIDTELDHVLASSDPVDTDEPVREPYETRLHNLQAAALALEGRVDADWSTGI